MDQREQGRAYPDDPWDPIRPRIRSSEALCISASWDKTPEAFANALKSALREDPDVVLVGEMRDLETIQLAITAAETGPR
ncbi:MAG: ATPase, T2SS/T4P/T4SS family [Vampirovibrionales bacterium]